MKVELNKKLITPFIFILGVLVTIFFERIIDYIIPQESETVSLSRDTLYVIPLERDKVITEELSSLDSLKN